MSQVMRDSRSGRSLLRNLEGKSQVPLGVHRGTQYLGRRRVESQIVCTVQALPSVCAGPKDPWPAYLGPWICRGMRCVTGM